MKKLSILLLALLVTGAVVAQGDVAETSATKAKQTRANRAAKKNGGEAANSNETAAIVTDSYSRGPRERGCATGSCHTREVRHHEHSCRTHNCGVCHEAKIPAKPRCTKAVEVTEEPCLHKQVAYSWTCPVGTTLEEKGMC